MKKIPFTTLTKLELAEKILALGEPKFRADQVWDWVYEKKVLSFDKMENLSKTLREKLDEVLTLSSLTFVTKTESNDQETVKYLWELSDGKRVESVLILSGKRRTVCVSSQVGCPAACAFCASGKMGFFRNLSAHEIYDQVVRINAELQQKGERVSHVVFMGMGEPLKNYDPVISAIRQLTDPAKLNLSDRRITVSTVGIVEGIERLSGEGIKVNLVLSLHAPNQHIRKKIIPYARKYELADIMKAMDTYHKKTGRDITYEYTLIEGINDHPDHAFELAHLVKGRHCTVNLIPYNPVPGVRLNRPSGKEIKAFRSVLFGCKIPNTCRWTKGDDIAAACGQLAYQNPPQSVLPLSASC